MINNLKEFFESQGICELNEAAMYQYGRALYKYTFGPWTSYLVESAPAQDIEYSIIIKRADTGGAIFAPDGVIPEDIADFFMVGEDRNEYTFDEYAELIVKFADEHDNLDWDYTLISDTLVITGIHKIPATVSNVYYEDKAASNDTLTLADKCVGIKVGSIIEGADYDATPFELYFPFEEEEYSEKLDELASEVEQEWKKNNSLYFSITEAATGETISYNRWVSMDDEPTGNWAEDDKESKELAIAAGNALWEADLADTDIPGHPGYRVKEEEKPIY